MIYQNSAVKRTLLGLLFATASCFLFEGAALAVGMNPAGQSPNPLVLAPGQTGTVTYQITQSIPMPIKSVTVSGFPGTAVPSLGSCANHAASCSFTVTYTQPVSGGSYTPTVSVVSQDRQITGTSFTTTISPSPISSVSIQPLSATVVAGEKTAPFTVTGCNYQNGFKGACPAGAAVVWRSDNTGAATIDSSSGIATGVAVGSVNITAMMGGAKSAAAVLTVTAAQVTKVSVVLQSGAASMPLGKTAILAANCDYTDGSTAECTSNVAWHVSPNNVVSVGANGAVTTNAAGSTTVTASAGGVTSSGFALTVTPAQLTSIAVSPSSSSIAAGNTTQLAAACTYTNGVSACPTLDWASSNAADATVTASGLVKGVAAGSPTITASYTPSGGVKISGSANVTVGVAVLTGIALTPNAASVVAGNTQQFTPVCTFTNGSGTCPTLAFASSDDSLAAVDPSGLAKGLKEGKPVITASYTPSAGAKVVGSASLSVGSAVINSVKLSLTGSATLALGRTAALTATCGYTDNTSQNCTSTVAWGYSSNGIVTVGSDGTVATNQVGSTTVTATVGGVKSSGGVTFTVDSKAVTGVTLSLASGSPSTLPLGKKTALVATCAYTDKTLNDCTSQATWGYSSSGIVTVTGGVVATTAVGTTLVTATVSGIASNGVSLTVGAKALTTISVSPNSVGVAEGSSQQFNPTCAYTDGSSDNCSTRKLSWISSNNTFATVSPTGLATAGNTKGNAIITASYTPSGGAAISGSATLSVGKAVLTGITVSGPASVAAGNSVSFTAVCTYTNGVGPSCPALSWTSSDNTVATVDPTGLAKGLKEGKPTIMASYTPSASAGAKVVGSASLKVTAAQLQSVTVMTSASLSVDLGSSVPFSASCTYTNGQGPCGGNVNWSVSSGGGTVTPEGVFSTGSSTGQSTVKATVTMNGVTQSGSATVTVADGSPASIRLTPSTMSFQAGVTPSTTSFTAQCENTNNKLVPCAGLTWSVSNSGSVVKIQPDGSLTPGNTVGTATVTAALGSGASTSGTVNITPGPAYFVSLNSTSMSLAVGSTGSFTATCTDGFGNSASCSGLLSWGVTSTTGGANPTIDQSGTVTSAGRAGGVANIAVKLNRGQGAGFDTATATVTIAAGTVIKTVTVTGSANEVIAGSKQPVTYAATCLDASVNPVTPCVAAWSVANANGGAATIDPKSGNVTTGSSTGTATVTATISGVSGSANLIISPVTVSPVLYFQVQSSITNTASQPVVGTIVISNPAAGSGGESGDAINSIAVTLPSGFALTAVNGKTNTTASNLCGQINAGNSCALQITAQAPIDFTTPPVITVAANDMTHGAIQPINIPVSPLGMILMTPKVQLNAAQNGFNALMDGNVYVVNGCKTPRYIKFENIAKQPSAGSSIISAVGMKFQDQKGNAFDSHHYAFNAGSCASTTFDGVPYINSASSCVISIMPTTAASTKMQLALTVTSNGTELAYTIPVMIEAGGQQPPQTLQPGSALFPVAGRAMELLTWDVSCNQLGYGIVSQSSGLLPWWNVGNSVDTNSMDDFQKTDGGGVMMTAAIVNAVSGQSGAPATTSFAAGVCDGLLHTDQNGDVHGNWYLPSFAELVAAQAGVLYPFANLFLGNHNFWTSTLFANTTVASKCTAGSCAYTFGTPLLFYYPVNTPTEVMCYRTVTY